MIQRSRRWWAVTHVMVFLARNGILASDATETIRWRHAFRLRDARR